MVNRMGMSPVQGLDWSQPSESPRPSTITRTPVLFASHGREVPWPVHRDPDSMTLALHSFGIRMGHVFGHIVCRLGLRPRCRRLTSAPTDGRVRMGA